MTFFVWNKFSRRNVSCQTLQVHITFCQFRAHTTSLYTWSLTHGSSGPKYTSRNVVQFRSDIPCDSSLPATRNENDETTKSECGRFLGSSSFLALQISNKMVDETAHIDRAKEKMSKVEETYARPSTIWFPVPNAFGFYLPGNFSFAWIHQPTGWTHLTGNIAMGIEVLCRQAQSSELVKVYSLCCCRFFYPGNTPRLGLYPSKFGPMSPMGWSCTAEAELRLG